MLITLKSYSYSAAAAAGLLDYQSTRVGSSSIPEWYYSKRQPVASLRSHSCSRPPYYRHPCYSAITSRLYRSGCHYTLVSDLAPLTHYFKSQTP